jgi:antitoxin StbD
MNVVRENRRDPPLKEMKMTVNISTKNEPNSSIPISRFHHGETRRIFDEVKEAGAKIVVKRNIPICILMAPKLHEALMEMLADHFDLIEAEERLNSPDNGESIPFEDVLKKAGFIQPDLDEDDNVEIE